MANETMSKAKGNPDLPKDHNKLDPRARLLSMREESRMGGGPERLAAHRSKGKLTARERIEVLPISGPFL